MSDSEKIVQLYWYFDSNRWPAANTAWDQDALERKKKNVLAQQ